MTEVVLGDYIDLLTGYPFSSEEYTETGGDILVIRGSNIGAGYLKWEGAKRYPAEKIGDSSKFFLEDGDLLIAMDRPIVRDRLKWSRVLKEDTPSLLVQRVARLRPLSKLSQNYLRVLIDSPQFSAYVNSVLTGINIPHISINFVIVNSSYYGFIIKTIQGCNS